MIDHILYNPKSNNGKGKEGIERIKLLYPADKLILTSVFEVESYAEYFANIPEEDRFILVGGDGTLHHFVNDIEGLEIDRDIYYQAAGSGNDFMIDVGRTAEEGPFIINDYIRNLPIVTVNGKRRRFVNNVGYGIDGYACEVADLQRETSRKKINYTWIVLKGFLGGYHPANAAVTVDGVVKTYNDVWLAPTMNGRYCGGGMMVTPGQDRLDPERNVSVAVMHSRSKFKVLIRFKTVFKGEHIKYRDMVEVIKGHEIRVVFDTPCALQIDGETVLGVLQYSVSVE